MDNVTAEIKVIKTAEQHAQAVEELLRLMSTDDTSSDDRIELLSLVIEDYERRASPSPCVDPVDAIRFRMDQTGMTAKDLTPYIGSQSKVSEILNRKRPLTLAMIRNLHKGLGIPADVLLIDSQSTIDLSSEVALDYSEFPLKEMAQRGYFGAKYLSASRSQLKDMAEELWRSFFGDNKSTYSVLLRAPQTQMGTRTMNDAALHAWKMIVEKKASAEKLSVKFSPDVITDEWLNDLVKLSSFKEGPKLAKEYLARAGIVLVVEPHFQKTYLDGASMLLKDRAVVGLTLRYDRLDNFWFVLLHEIAHLKLHLNESNTIIIDDMDDKTQRAEALESEADAFATSALIPDEKWLESDVSISHEYSDALRLSQNLGISVAIVAGRVRKETGNWRLLHSHLGKGEVKAMF